MLGAGSSKYTNRRRANHIARSLKKFHARSHLKYTVLMSAIAQSLNLAAPIIQAPMAGSQGYELAAAVCNAGGLGSLPAAMHTPESLLDEIGSLRQLTDKPFNINFFAHQTPTDNPAALAAWHQVLAPYYLEFCLDSAQIPTGTGRAPFSAAFAHVIDQSKPAVVSFHFGLPENDLLQRVKATGAQIWSSATTLDEALWLEAHGVDAIIAQGLEAGGHRGMFLTNDLNEQVPLTTLLEQIVARVRVPVIAAGGIATAAEIVRAKGLGVDAVQIGTAYLCTPEATTSPIHRAALCSEQASNTALTNLFSGRPARGIVNRIMRERGPMSPVAPAFPLATAGITPLRTAAERTGSSDFSPLWAGQNAKAIQILSAAELTEQFINAWHR